ncbi:MAG: OmpA family protein, partial [Enterobacteriaceae bacterium]
LAMIIMKITEAHNAQSNLQMEIVPQGLRILLQDDQHQEMFQRGRADLTPFFQKLLKELAPVFEKIDNKIVITGHTDGTQYPDGVRYNNWNLSGERAMAARQALELGGMPAQQVIQVSGMADQMLLDDKNPEAMKNRRIEIMILTRTAADTLYQFFNQNGEKIAVPPTTPSSR